MGRGGLGAVLGRKNLKAVAVDGDSHRAGGRPGAVRPRPRGRHAPVPGLPRDLRGARDLRVRDPRAGRPHAPAADGAHGELPPHRVRRILRRTPARRSGRRTARKRRAATAAPSGARRARVRRTPPAGVRDGLPLRGPERHRRPPRDRPLERRLQRPRDGHDLRRGHPFRVGRGAGTVPLPGRDRPASPRHRPPAGRGGSSRGGVPAGGGGPRETGALDVGQVAGAARLRPARGLRDGAGLRHQQPGRMPSAGVSHLPRDPSQAGGVGPVLLLGEGADDQDRGGRERGGGLPRGVQVRLLRRLPRGVRGAALGGDRGASHPAGRSRRSGSGSISRSGSTTRGTASRGRTTTCRPASSPRRAPPARGSTSPRSTAPGSGRS